jgi:hypothetical protein
MLYKRHVEVTPGGGDTNSRFLGGCGGRIARSMAVVAVRLEGTRGGGLGHRGRGGDAKTDEREKHGDH